MRPAEQKVLRGAVLRHLRSAYGISLKKRISERVESSTTTAACPQVNHTVVQPRHSGSGMEEGFLVSVLLLSFHRKRCLGFPLSSCR